MQSSTATSDPVGAELFATADEGLLPGPLAALSFGGIWNAEVVPASRTGWAGVVLTALLVAAAAVAVVRLARGRARVTGLGGLVVCWAVGYGLAVLSWAAPGVLGWLAAHVPGGGLLRDGSRLLGLAVPLAVVLVAVAVDALLDRLPDRPTRVLVGGVLALVPLSLMPDALWGVGGQLSAVSYPAAYDDARAAVSRAPAGDAVSLPFVSYRAPVWNDGGRRVLDPLGRYLDRPVVVNDELVVSGTRIAGEDPRAAQVRTALEAPSPEARAAAAAGGRRLGRRGRADRGLPGPRGGRHRHAGRRPDRRRARSRRRGTALGRCAAPRWERPGSGGWPCRWPRSPGSCAAAGRPVPDMRDIRSRNWHTAAYRLVGSRSYLREGHPQWDLSSRRS